MQLLDLLNFFNMSGISNPRFVATVIPTNNDRLTCIPIRKLCIVEEPNIISSVKEKTSVRMLMMSALIMPICLSF